MVTEKNATKNILDGRKDGKTDGRTDRGKTVYPPPVEQENVWSTSGIFYSQF
jgi:hypothetical protein